MVQALKEKKIGEAIKKENLVADKKKTGVSPKLAKLAENKV